MIYDKLNELDERYAEYFDGISPLSYIVLDCTR